MLEPNTNCLPNIDISLDILKVIPEMVKRESIGNSHANKVRDNDIPMPRKMVNFLEVRNHKRIADIAGKKIQMIEDVIE